MSETNNSGDKSLGASGAKATLHLKRPVEQGTVRQSFSHGRSKVVVVEKKRRVLGPGEVAAARAPRPRLRAAALGRSAEARARARCARRAARPDRRARAGAAAAARPASSCRR